MNNGMNDELRREIAAKLREGGIISPLVDEFKEAVYADEYTSFADFIADLIDRPSSAEHQRLELLPTLRQGGGRVKCPKCGSEKSKVVDVRRNQDYLTSKEDAICRRRECRDCGARFTTYELRADQITFEE